MGGTRSAAPSIQVSLLAALAVALWPGSGHGGVRMIGEPGSPNTVIYLPEVKSDKAVLGQEPLLFWWQTGPDDLVVTTAQHVVRLRRGKLAWAQRLRSLDTSGHHLAEFWRAPIALCLASGDVLLGVYRKHTPHWVRWSNRPSGFHEMSLAALSVRSGRILAQGSCPLPESIWPDVAAMIPWQKGALALFGGGRGFADFPWVEYAIRFAYAKGQIRIVETDPFGLKETYCYGRRLDKAGSSCVVSRSTRAKAPDGTWDYWHDRAKVFRSPDRIYEISARKGQRVRLGEWSAVIHPTHTLLLRDQGSGKPILVAFDLHTGEMRWRVPWPGNIPGGSDVAIQGDRIVAVRDDRDEHDGIVMIDTRSGKVTAVLGRKPDGTRWNLAFGPVAFLHGEDVVFAVASEWPDANGKIVYSVYRVPISGGQPKRVTQIRAPEGFGPGGLREVKFLLPSSDGFWLGLASGVIAYREWKALEGATTRPAK